MCQDCFDCQDACSNLDWDAAKVGLPPGSIRCDVERLDDECKDAAPGERYIPSRLRKTAALGAEAGLRCVSGTAGGCNSNCHDVVQSMLLDCKRTDPINGLALTRILAADKCALLTC